MQRRHFLFLAPLLPSAFFAPRLHARGRQMPAPHNLRDETLKLNELASNIHTVADARRFIDAIADLFADDLPPAWTTNSLRARLGQAEYLTVTDPHRRIPEQHLAEIWNTYLAAIGAPDDSRVSAAEIHYLRDAFFANGRVMWDRGYRNFWLLPSIFATNPDRTLAPACRIVESLRILYDLDRFPQNLAGAREAVAKGILTSDVLKHAQQQPRSAMGGRASLSVGASGGNPVEAAAARYIRAHGMAAFTQTVETMLNSLTKT